MCMSTAFLPVRAIFTYSAFAPSACMECDQLEGDASLGLGGADEHLYAELAGGERGEAVGLHVFEIDQDVVSGHVW